MTQMVAERVGPFELQVVCALRERGWRAVDLDELGTALRGRVRRRAIRYHLARLVEIGAVEEVSWRGRQYGWRWSADAPDGYVERCETAARAAGGALPPVAARPETCGCGGKIDGAVWHDGMRQCTRCGRWH